MYVRTYFGDTVYFMTDRWNGHAVRYTDIFLHNVLVKETRRGRGSGRGWQYSINTTIAVTAAVTIVMTITIAIRIISMRMLIRINININIITQMPTHQIVTPL